MRIVFGALGKKKPTGLSGAVGEPIESMGRGDWKSTISL
jgi:hypothetical protein